MFISFVYLYQRGVNVVEQFRSARLTSNKIMSLGNIGSKGITSEKVIIILTFGLAAIITSLFFV